MNETKTKRLLSLLVFLLFFVVAATGVGAIIGAAISYADFGGPKYQSQTTVLIELPPADAGSGRPNLPRQHDQIIASHRNISDLFNKKKLYQLDCFAGLEDDRDIVIEVQKNLHAEFDAESSVLTICFVCSQPNDASIVLNHLVAGYERTIEAALSESSSFEGVIETMTRQLDANVARANEELDVARKKLELLAVSEDKSAIENAKMEVDVFERKLSREQGALAVALDNARKTKEMFSDPNLRSTFEILVYAEPGIRIQPQIILPAGIGGIFGLSIGMFLASLIVLIFWLFK